MQDLRRLAVVWILAVTAFAGDSFRVTTWNLKWFPSGGPTKASPEVEDKRILDAAQAIEVINPDVLLLQEVRDWEICERLAAAIQSAKYHVAVVSAFKEPTGTVGWQQVAILAKQYADSAWSDSWKSRGVVDPPRGYAFATFRYGNALVGFYSIHLKSNLVRGDHFSQTQTNILKRELAAEQLLDHTREVGRTHGAQLKAIVVGGDFNTNLDHQDYVSEKTLRIFNDAGFLNPLISLPLIQRITIPASGPYPDTTFDYILSRGLKPLSAPEITGTVVSDHYPVTMEFTW